ncbi:MAG: ParA family protein [Polyangiaceae bacterium]|nr:ParA family protein [Polyangiaceae bacterium]
MSVAAPPPRVFAFYAYKGGTGRTTALIHVAWALARDGRRVVMLDLDLSAPSIWPLVFPDRAPEAGFVEYLVTAARDPDTRLADYLHEVSLDDDARGELRVFGAGKLDAAYLRALRSLDWQRLLTPRHTIDAAGQLGLATQPLFDHMLEALGPVADVLLIDAPTGLNDTANVCLRRLADTVVVVFTPSRVQMEGVGRIVSLLAAEQAEHGRPDVLCVASTLHAHRLSFEHLRAVERTFDYLERVRYEALGRPSLDDPEKRDAVEQPRMHVPYEPALADLDALRFDRAPGSDDMLLYRDLVTVLLDAVPMPALPEARPPPELTRARKEQVLTDLLAHFPQPVAEHETESEAFLRAAHVRAVLDPTTVLIHGGKGSGKTALFRYFMAARTDAIAVHGPSIAEPGVAAAQLGMDALSAMVDAGLEMDVVWRVYALSRLPALPIDTPEHARRAVDDLARLARGETFFDRGSTSLGAEGLGPAVHTTWQAVDRDLENRGEHLLLLVDGLDTPFKGSLERRRRGIEGLFIAWGATFQRLRRLQLKVFLRSDLWHELSFPEKSHVGARAHELKWEPLRLWQMLLKRALRSSSFAQWCEEWRFRPPLTWDEVEDAAERTLVAYLEALFERHIWTKKKALSRNWLTRRLKDAREILYPRDTLWLVRRALEGEAERLRGDRRTSNEAAISREALAAALLPTSEQRVSAVREESPELVDVLNGLNGFSAQGELAALREHLAARPGANAAEDLERLQRTGVLRLTDGKYSVPDLYVAGLKMKRPGPK